MTTFKSVPVEPTEEMILPYGHDIRTQARKKCEVYVDLTQNCPFLDMAGMKLGHSK